MTRPRLLDLFAGAQGAGVGYARAGFDVHAIDIEPHVLHPEIASFTVADAMDVLADGEFCRGFDVIHASPPCQRYSTQTGPRRDEHPDLIGPVRAALHAIGRPWVVENVGGARRELDHPIMLCGSMFGLGVRRHRYFEVSIDVWPPQCRHPRERPWTVTGDHPDTREHVRPGGSLRGRKPRSVEHARELMGIDWMDWRDICEAIPPAYTSWVGEQLLVVAGQDPLHGGAGHAASPRDLRPGDPECGGLPDGRMNVATGVPVRLKTRQHVIDGHKSAVLTGHRGELLQLGDRDGPALREAEDPVAELHGPHVVRDADTVRGRQGEGPPVLGDDDGVQLELGLVGDGHGHGSVLQGRGGTSHAYEYAPCRDVLSTSMHEGGGR
jgi:DNA (cytosine-5)-methyltransferase 1